MSSLKLRSGGRILVDQLVAQGVERVYCVPGESYLARARRALRFWRRRHDLPAGGGRGDHGG